MNRCIPIPVGLSQSIVVVPKCQASGFFLPPAYSFSTSTCTRGRQFSLQITTTVIGYFDAFIFNATR